ncbi:MAG: ornithine carbamoyltransferase [Bacillota bacterium]|nr:MAG: ornithine carbamoyltransferase [Bacillota bacterium]
MRNGFAGRDFLTLMDFAPHEILHILDTAGELKRKWSRREPHELLRGKTVAVLFEKKSTRTRVSFQAAIAHLGAQSFYLRPDELQTSRGEPIKDTARVIDRYCDALVIRTFGQEIVEEFAHWMKWPVINALTDLTHPCQGLADLLTIREKKGGFKGLKLCYSGDVWNVCHSLMVVSALLGMEMSVAVPAAYKPHPRITEFVEKTALSSGGKVVFTTDLKKAVKSADVVYANTWHSMGGPEESKEQRIRDFAPFQISEETMALADPTAIFMHCLPGYRGEEMTDGVIEGRWSVVFDQAENRMHTEKAVLALVMS